MGNTSPGINPQFDLVKFSKIEQKIIRKFGIEWYVTHSGGELKLGKNANYRYFLIKPADNYQEMFNFEREIIVILSNYENFEPRTLDAIDLARSKYQQLRLERICSVLISGDKNVETKLQEILNNDQESQIVIPFTYNELSEPTDDYFMRNRFKNHFFTRDLFAFEGPLKKDIYFFGRNDIVHSIANRHKAHENSALFGLRKTGKTSIIFGVQRALEKMGVNTLIIDCQNPSFHQRTWNKALFYIVSELKNQFGISTGIKIEEKYTPESAARTFEREFIRLNKTLGEKSLLLIFDEIENITFSVSPTSHWEKGNDFIYFWQTLRSIYQKFPNLFSYLIVGTNSMCIETPTINGKDNPIFNQVPFNYIEGFTVPDTREMVRKLGRLMGLKFDEIIFSKLTEDFGGHPFLIRHVCSAINKICDKDRPVFVDKVIYEKGKEKFNKENSNYYEMILTVLSQYYNDEYEMLKFLAADNYKDFDQFANMDPYYTQHLLGYDVITAHNSNYTFKISSLREYLLKSERIRKVNLSNEEKRLELSKLRNRLEIDLRKLVKQQLYANLGPEKAKQCIIAIFDKKRSKLAGELSLNEIFDGNTSMIYFEELRKIISKKWEFFSNIISDKDFFNTQMKTINKFRCDAHAKDIDDDDFEFARSSIWALQKQLDQYFE